MSNVKTHKDLDVWNKSILGSLAELETQILLAKRLGYLGSNTILSKIDNIRQMILGLISYLKKP
jgi:four helix bundle protein